MPALSLSVFAYVPYTEEEMKENALKKQQPKKSPAKKATKKMKKEK